MYSVYLELLRLMLYILPKTKVLTKVDIHFVYYKTSFSKIKFYKNPENEMHLFTVYNLECLCTMLIVHRNQRERHRTHKVADTNKSSHVSQTCASLSTCKYCRSVRRQDRRSVRMGQDRYKYGTDGTILYSKIGSVFEAFILLDMQRHNIVFLTKGLFLFSEW